MIYLLCHDNSNKCLFLGGLLTEVFLKCRGEYVMTYQDLHNMQSLIFVEHNVLIIGFSVNEEMLK